MGGNHQKLRENDVKNSVRTLLLLNLKIYFLLKFMQLAREFEASVSSVMHDIWTKNFEVIFGVKNDFGERFIKFQDMLYHCLPDLPDFYLKK